MIKEKIISEIKNNQSGISIDTFIDICLFDKEGYYNNLNSIGRSGDFITSPKISQLFGEILGLYIYNIWKKKFQSKFNLVELGPGDGTLLIDILRITKTLPGFHQNMNMYLIEKNKYFLKKQNQKLIKNNFDNINHNWHNDFKNITRKPTIIFSNEFFDCFPVKQFIKKNSKWYEKNINYNEGEDNFYYQNLLIEENKLFKKLSKYDDQDIVEFSEKRATYFDKICKHISKSSGTFITIDYGYYNFPGHFTLQSIFNHQFSNLLDNVGKQDITSLVDFKQLINIAKNNKLNIDNYCNQREFLLNYGIDERKNIILKKCNDIQKIAFKKNHRKLIEKNKMGSDFKFLILSNY